MATVRFSTELCLNVKQNAENMFFRQIEAAGKNYPRTWGETVYDLMFKDTKAIMYSLPEGFMGETSTITFSGLKGGGWHEVLNQGIRLDLPEARLIPAGGNAKSQGVIEVSLYNRCLDASDPRWDTFKVEYAAYCHEIMRLEARRDAFVAGVKKITETYSTLAPALKAWPPLWDLIPADKQAKHKEIVERKKSGEVVVEGVDLNSLSGVVIAAKITR